MPLLDDGTCIPSGFSIGTYEQREGVTSNLINSNTELHLGWVVGAHYPAGEETANGGTILYDIVAYISQGEMGAIPVTFHNARWAGGNVGSISDFCRVRLNSAKGYVNGQALSPEQRKQASFVAFLCENGRSQSPVIIGVAEHPDLPPDKKEYGHYFAQSFNGVNTLIDKDGEYSVTFTGATLDEVKNTYIVPETPLPGQIRTTDFSKTYTVAALPPLPKGMVIPPMPKLPSGLPALPKFPLSLPKPPAMPSVPMPGVPAGIPGLPGMPPLPSLPGAPSLPVTPAIPGSGQSIPSVPGGSLPSTAIPSGSTIAQASVPGLPSTSAITNMANSATSITSSISSFSSPVPKTPAGPSTIKLDKEGSIIFDNTNGESITLNKPYRAIQIQARSMVTVVTDEDQFTYVPNGRVTFLAGTNFNVNAARIYLGTETSTDPAVLGNQLAMAFQELLMYFMADPIGIAGNIPVMMSPVLKGNLMRWKAKYAMPFVSGFLSKKVFVE
jgi:hypothetical protein